MKENAIIIRQLDIIKTHIDFSDLDNIARVIYADKVSTIHTVKTQELSQKLGIHLIGFVSRDCDDINNEKACEISGYDYLGSLMFLCKTDDKLNPLPFNEEELEIVYHYLLTGQIEAKGLDEETSKFFAKFDIDPVLPVFTINPKGLFVKGYPNVIILKYDFSEEGEDVIYEIGKELANYAGRIFEITEAYGDYEEATARSKDKKYCLHNYTNIVGGYFFVFIQALPKGNEKSVLKELENKFLGGEIEFVREYSQVGERSKDEQIDLDLLVPYVLEIRIKASWPNLKDCKSQLVYAFPLFRMYDEKIEVPDFPGSFVIEDVDTWNDKLSLKVKFDKERTLDLEKDWPETVSFDYQTNPEKMSTHRVGEATLILKKYDVDVDGVVEGKVEVHEEYIVEGKEHYDEHLTVENLTINDLETRTSLQSNLTSYFYDVTMVAPKQNFVLINRNFYDTDTEKFERYYYPLCLGDEIHHLDEYNGEDGHTFMNIHLKFVK